MRIEDDGTVYHKGMWFDCVEDYEEWEDGASYSQESTYDSRTDD